MRIITQILDDSVYVMVEYLACGHRGKYTVYRLPQSGLQTPRIIGRELGLKFAKQHIRNVHKRARYK